MSTVKQGIKRRAVLARSLCTVGAFGAPASVPASAAAIDEQRPIDLPGPDKGAAPSLHEALLRRRSVRNFRPSPVSLAAISHLLWAAQGVTASEGRRTAPSAGALYPIELYLVAARVEGLGPGVYRYRPLSHQMLRVAADIDLPALAKAALSQPSVAGAAAVVIIAAAEARTAGKYGARASRYVAFEAGAVSQNLALQAAADGLGSVVVGAFDDSAVALALRLPAGERPVALMPTGVPG